MQDWQRSSKHMLPSYNISLARAGCVLRHMRKGMEWYSTVILSGSFSEALFAWNILESYFWDFQGKLDWSQTVFERRWNLPGKVLTCCHIDSEYSYHLRILCEEHRRWEWSHGLHRAKDLDSTMRQRSMTVNSLWIPRCNMLQPHQTMIIWWVLRGASEFLRQRCVYKSGQDLVLSICAPLYYIM
jgi:hypothetical protein